jgi:hypothetical protein
LRDELGFDIAFEPWRYELCGVTIDMGVCLVPDYFCGGKGEA